MSSIAEQIKDVQEILRKQAERLGELNLKSNDFIQQNQKIALQIVELKNKITKKKHMIEQENKDKMLIHQKLIKAEREKQLLQIENHRKQQLKLKQLQKQQEQNNQTITNHIQTLTTQNKEINHEKSLTPSEGKNLEEAYKSENHQENVEQTTEEKQDKAQQTHGQQYTETSRGEYQPPMLFEENSNASEEKQQKSEDEDSDEEDEDILSKLRATVKHDDEENQEKQ